MPLPCQSRPGPEPGSLFSEEFPGLPFAWCAIRVVCHLSGLPLVYPQADGQRPDVTIYRRPAAREAARGRPLPLIRNSAGSRFYWVETGVSLPAGTLTVTSRTLV